MMGKRKLLAAALAIGIGFISSACERTCKPLELRFNVTTATDPGTGRSWDRGTKARQAPDPMGYVVVTTKGKRYSESIAQRRDTFDFRGRFYARRGVPLRMGSKIEAIIEDKDLTKTAPIGRIEHKVRSPRSGAAQSSNGAVKLTYTCHSN